MSSQSRLPRWAGRTYLLQTSAVFITGLGNSGALIASAFAVLEAGGGSTGVGLVAAARTLPLVVFLLVGGVIADRFPRHHVMVAANAANALSQGAFAVFVLTGGSDVWVMMVLAGIGGSAHALYLPAAQGLLFSTLDAEDAGPALAAYRVAVSSSHIGGAALGGVLTTALGPGAVLALDAGGFVLAALLRVFMRIPAMGPGEDESMLRQLHDGWRAFVARRWLWGIVLQFALLNGMMVAGETVFGPVVSEDHWGAAWPWGVAMSALGAGTLLGGLVLVRYRPRRLLNAGNWGLLPLAPTFVALAIPAPWPILALSMFVCGVGMEVFSVCWMLTLRQEIPAEYVARVSAYDWLGSMALAPACTALAGPAGNTFGNAGVLWVFAGACVVLILGVFAIPEVRALSGTGSVHPVEPAHPVEPVEPAEPAKAETTGAT
ncbi:MFS transporter [Embleya sp. NBC_00896]|uniref:MFS transporter n=1 Tax=Embleya sp. NBC_00896 TaxID=2975961 RepID=UPI0038673DF4|nr:MFS transporter [Embleya sp. NBC_00896]